ncbi:UDP-D-xylose:L-fucose alpha-1,3-D-xylosyltransferase 1-like [Patiria miniata]|uniref:Nucleotide-diphospho-sugar transferase domain-containing protein n=1 Tax=Patiria miniata TaxID=46514 RepID=A0A914B1U0_PATMI|nr:UDP-D-xylose:L-fucose alpha-1,3-D-xylosyltransferase 1-like [Patiria miniata]
MAVFTSAKSSTSNNRAAVEKARSMVLTTTNAGFLSMTLNMLESIRRFKTASFPNVTVITEDQQSYDYLAKKTEIYPFLIVQKTNGELTTSQRLLVGRSNYNQFVRRRPRYILQFLESGFEVLFADADTFWVRDPFKDFEGDFDIAAHNEVDPPRKPVFCDGFTYYRPTENTFRLIQIS